MRGGAGGGEGAGGLALERFEEVLFFFWEARGRGAGVEGEVVVSVGR